MNKFQVSDIVIKSSGVQIRDKILNKYGTIEKFADEINLYDSTINQYLSSKTLGSSTFKLRTVNALGIHFDDLYKSDEEQLRYLTSETSWYIQNYNTKKDILVLEKLKKLSLERELMEDYAIVCRCYAHYYMNIGKLDRAYAYIEVAVNTMRDRKNKDRFGLYLSDLIKIKALELNRALFKKLVNESMENLKSVNGVITTGNIYLNIAEAYFAFGEYEKSRECYNKMFDFIKEDKSKSLVFIGLGNIEKVLNNYDKAFDYYRLAESLLNESDPEMYYVYDEMSIYYYDKSMYDRAEEYIDKVFVDKKYKITATKNTRIETYIMVKLALGKNKDILKLVTRLLNEIKYDYIYAVSHLERFDNIFLKSKTSEVFNNSIKRIIKKFYLTNDIDLEYKKILRQILGSICFKE